MSIRRGTLINVSVHVSTEQILFQKLADRRSLPLHALFTEINMVASIERNEHFICPDSSIEMLRSAGILKMLEENALPMTNEDDLELPRTQATLEDILPILIILLVGLLASVLSLLAEIIFFRLNSHIRKQSVNIKIRS
jgi:hypothetical protein